MMAEGNEGNQPERHGNELSFLDLSLILPVDPRSLANERSSGDIHGMAIGEVAVIAGMDKRIKELRDDLDLAQSKRENAESRKLAFIEAYELAQAMEQNR